MRPFGHKLKLRQGVAEKIRNARDGCPRDRRLSGWGRGVNRSGRPRIDRRLGEHIVVDDKRLTVATLGIAELAFVADECPIGGCLRLILLPCSVIFRKRLLVVGLGLLEPCRAGLRECRVLDERRGSRPDSEHKQKRQHASPRRTARFTNMLFSQSAGMRHTHPGRRWLKVFLSLNGNSRQSVRTTIGRFSPPYSLRGRVPPEPFSSAGSILEETDAWLQRL